MLLFFFGFLGAESAGAGAVTVASVELEAISSADRFSEAATGLAGVGTI
jgi:hypothetical protein